MKLVSLRGDHRPTVICEGHVDKVAFADSVDTDDVAEILGDDCEIAGSYPTQAAVTLLSEKVRHSWGVWGIDGKKRWWIETRKSEAGASPFTVVDRET